MHLYFKKKSITIFLSVLFLFVLFFLNDLRNNVGEKNTKSDIFTQETRKLADTLKNSTIIKINAQIKMVNSSSSKPVKSIIKENLNELASSKKLEDIKLLKFEVLDELPDTYQVDIQKYMDLITKNKRLGSANFRISAKYNEYSYEHLAEEDADLDLKKRVFNALMYHSLLGCRKKIKCRVGVGAATVPASRISNADYLAWLRLYNSFEPQNPSTLNLEEELINKLRLDEIEFADYKFNNLTYYISDQEYPFPSFLEDYWNR